MKQAMVGDIAELILNKIKEKEGGLVLEGDKSPLQVYLAVQMEIVR